MSNIEFKFGWISSTTRNLTSCAKPTLPVLEHVARAITRHCTFLLLKG
jgi:hypothetical protein